ncbi:MAG: hypothetical protein EBR51_07990 [Gammaproteobacteria bacterium]|jgi:hypothetical protein|nr:hypothetical protein [Gammaproteobacteria bacterium]
MQGTCHGGRESRAQAPRPAADLRGVNTSKPILALLASLSLAGCASVQLSDPAQPPSAIEHSLEGAFRLFRPSFVSTTPAATEKAAVTEKIANVRPRTLATEALAPPSLVPDHAEDIVAVGFASIGAQSGKDPAQQRLMAARASKVDAYRNLAEQVYGVSFGSETVLEDHKLQQDSVRTRIVGMLNGAELVSMEPLGSDTYQTTLRLPANRVQQLRQRLQR